MLYRNKTTLIIFVIQRLISNSFPGFYSIFYVLKHVREQQETCVLDQDNNHPSPLKFAIKILK